MFKAIVNFFKPYPAKVEEKPQSVVEAAPASAPTAQEEAKVVVVPNAAVPPDIVAPKGGWPFPDAPPAAPAPAKKPRKPRAPKAETAAKKKK